MFIKDKCHGQRGFTIAEMWLALAVGGVVISALMAFSMYSGKSFAALTNYVDLEQKSQHALDTMTREIRQTLCLTNFGTGTVNGRFVTNSVTFLDSDNNLLTYAYTNDVLLRQKGGTSTVLLTNVDFLSFQIFQRNNMAGTWDQYVAGDVASCKLVSISWICSRKILGSRLNSESVQTAKIVIRKE